LKLFEWFAGRFKEKEAVSEYSLDELAAVIKEECDQRKKESYSEISPILKDIYASFESIRFITLEIKELECPEDVNSRVKTVIRTAKPEFVREVLEALKESKKDAGDHPGREKAAIGEIIEMLAKAMIGPGKYLHMAYAEDIDRIRKELKKLAVKKKELEDTYEEDTSTEGLTEEIKTLRESLKHKKHLEKERSDTEKKLESLIKEQSALAKEISQICEGSEYRGYLEKKDALKRIQYEKEEKENVMYNLLTPLKRPVKILRKSLEDKGKADAMLKEMERITDEPIGSFRSSEPKDIMNLLTALKKRIDENQDLKAEEKSRIKQKIAAIEGTDLKRIREDISSLERYTKELSVEIDGAVIQKKKTLTEKNLESICRDVAHAIDESNRMSKKIEKDSEDIGLLKLGLEEKAGGLKKSKIIVRLA
jgi:hypothetical protein